MIDLFLGGPLGLWVLDNIDPGCINKIVTFTPEISIRARQLNIKVDYGIKNHPTGAVGLSMHYPRLLKPDMLSRYQVVYNIHPGFLPYGRCYYPVFWALWNNEPAGCTLHVIDEGIDTGPIVAQRQVIKYDWDTGGTLHRRVSDAEKGLFLEYWPLIAGGLILDAEPQQGEGTYHYKRDFFWLKQRAFTGEMDAPTLLKLIRCLSHEHYTGLEVSLEGRRYEISARGI